MNLFILTKFIPAHTLGKFFKVARFIISGGTAAVVNIATLYTLTEYIHLWYLLSAGIAFIVSVFLSFILQKMWTFRAHTGITSKQAILYLIVALINLGLNTLLLYVCVEYFKIHYVLSQIIVSGLIAFESYFAYRNFVFKTHGISEKVSNC